jgi:pentatricopeptide repeat protein
MVRASSRLAVAAFLGLALSSAAALAASTSGGSSGGSTTPTCPAGQVYDPATKSCIKLDSGILPDEDLYEQGRALAKAGRYDDALTVFAAMNDRSGAEVLTMIGYATRKLGRIDEGVAYYRQALAVDPDNLDTHEYLGEAYLQQGKPDLAAAELATLEALCGTECEQYEDLSAALAGQPED